jgi:hypothetical protein
MPAAGSFALRLVRAVRCCPLLVVKSNSAGAYLAHGSTAAGAAAAGRAGAGAGGRHARAGRIARWLGDRGSVCSCVS